MVILQTDELNTDTISCKSPAVWEIGWNLLGESEVRGVLESKIVEEDMS
jgi:hypothetical protein